ncbi:hypothetical protein EDB89DRAFT_2027164 [Lactarius sanguifluus]|nr:hypothetical protein EDB89DRAFT_2027164 [Lactarius sanguifluus]
MGTASATIFWTTFWGRLMGKRSPEPVPLSVPYWAGYHIWDTWCDLSLSKPSSHCLCWCIPLCFRDKRHRMFQNKNNNNNDAYSSPSDIFIFLITTAAAAGALTVLRGNRSETFFFYADTV